ncbi:hypothetical protein COCMIDRAFT_40976 [Bipolaris oryzae ATCC 44560]|uniref:PEBP-like protein n=1 Tax=Bipolaris oryzae ATCC 44560 TaxID=930090 RepID=W6YN63_COCMI|nr:uncharacterized protein COCMIDRAFT_40976 [Bipolaris oryzae ATCC 44560]EUC40742.1 hypothetical protein COCMIDRAFT_40976 [Bipolaris oryzae ATCC 44560]
MIFFYLLPLFAVAQTPPEFSPSCTKSLDVTYLSDQHVRPGQSLRQIDVINQPVLRPTHLQPDSNYILFLIDPDVVHDHNATTILHWYQPNCHVSQSTGDFVIPTYEGAHYVGSQPPQGEKHRYIFLLFEQPPKYLFPECFRSVFPITVDARSGFDIKYFMEITGLGSPVAANWFSVERAGGASTTRIITTTSLSRAPCKATQEVGHL